MHRKEQGDLPPKNGVNPGYKKGEIPGKEDFDVKSGFS
jgi:hypothetical protein